MNSPLIPLDFPLIGREGRSGTRRALCTTAGRSPRTGGASGPPIPTGRLRDTTPAMVHPQHITEEAGIDPLSGRRDYSGRDPVTPSEIQQHEETIRRHDDLLTPALRKRITERHDPNTPQDQSPPPMPGPPGTGQQQRLQQIPQYIVRLAQGENMEVKAFLRKYIEEWHQNRELDTDNQIDVYKKMYQYIIERETQAQAAKKTGGHRGRPGGSLIPTLPTIPRAPGQSAYEGYPDGGGEEDVDPGGGGRGRGIGRGRGRGVEYVDPRGGGRGRGRGRGRGERAENIEALLARIEEHRRTRPTHDVLVPSQPLRSSAVVVPAKEKDKKPGISVVQKVTVKS